MFYNYLYCNLSRNKPAHSHDHYQPARPVPPPHSFEIYLSTNNLTNTSSPSKTLPLNRNSHFSGMLSEPPSFSMWVFLVVFICLYLSPSLSLILCFVLISATDSSIISLSSTR